MSRILISLLGDEEAAKLACSLLWECEKIFNEVRGWKRHEARFSTRSVMLNKMDDISFHTCNQNFLVCNSTKYVFTYVRSWFTKILKNHEASYNFICLFHIEIDTHLSLRNLSQITCFSALLFLKVFKTLNNHWTKDAWLIFTCDSRGHQRNEPESLKEGAELEGAELCRNLDTYVSHVILDNVKPEVFECLLLLTQPTQMFIILNQVAQLVHFIL